MISSHTTRTLDTLVYWSVVEKSHTNSGRAARLGGVALRSDTACVFRHRLASAAWQPQHVRFFSATGHSWLCTVDSRGYIWVQHRLRVCADGGEMRDNRAMCRHVVRAGFLAVSAPALVAGLQVSAQGAEASDYSEVAEWPILATTAARSRRLSRRSSSRSSVDRDLEAATLAGARGVGDAGVATPGPTYYYPEQPSSGPRGFSQ